MTRDRTIEKGTFSPNSKQGGLYPVPPPNFLFNKGL